MNKRSSHPLKSTSKGMKSQKGGIQQVRYLWRLLDKGGDARDSTPGVAYRKDSRRSHWAGHRRNRIASRPTREKDEITYLAG